MYRYKYKYLYKYGPGVQPGEVTTVKRESWVNQRECPPCSSEDLAPSARAAILMDANTGKVLFEKNADEELLIASITKIMTAILALENEKLDAMVTVGPNAVGVEGSSVYLREGQEIPLRSLLYALMLRSGNDAAVAIAEHIGRSVEGFVRMMNEKAKSLGMTHSHFENPHGLDQPGHYSSARDMGKLASYAMKNGNFRKIVSTKEITVPWAGGTTQTFANKNRLLRMYKYANGVKTGYTKRAGRTLVSSAARNGVQLVAVTIQDRNDWHDAMCMFDCGFQQYNLKG